MEASDVIARLKSVEPALRRSGLRSLYLFGSRARGDHRPDSDVDLLFDSGRSDFSYFDLFKVKDDLADMLRLRVQLVERRALHPLMRPYVEPDLIRVF